jgi:hypothetical protein
MGTCSYAVVHCLDKEKLFEDYLYLIGYEDRAQCPFYMKRETEIVSETSSILFIHPLDITEQKYSCYVTNSVCSTNITFYGTVTKSIDRRQSLTSK